MNHYVMLVLAIAVEIVATSTLKHSNGFTNMPATAASLALYCLSFYLLSKVLLVMPVGIVYALWSGVGIVAITLVGWFLYQQKLDLPAICGIGLILAGVAVIHLFSKSVTG